MTVAAMHSGQRVTLDAKQEGSSPDESEDALYYAKY